MALEETLCPDCGSPMKSRTGQYGTFWGCTKYPACKGTRDSQGRSKADREKWKEEQESKNAERSEETSKERGKKEWNVK